MSQKTEEIKVNIESNNGEDKLAQRIVNLTNKLNIDTNTAEISLENCIRIIGEINKGVSEIKEIADMFINITPDEKAEKIYNIIIKLLVNPIILEKLSTGIRDQIKNYANNKELVSVIGDLVDWASDSILTGYDNNKDGIVTVDEISDDIVSCCLCKTRNKPEGCSCYRHTGCCKCCIKLSKSTGMCWGKFFTNVLCCGCGSNKVKYSS